MREIKMTRLVQRLVPPELGSPFAFGGGRRNGGHSDEAMELISPLFAFDYMGAAEFEFGAVPKALAKLARETGKEAGSVSGHVSIDLHKVSKELSGTVPVYYYAPLYLDDHVIKTIEELAYTPYGGSLKEPALLHQVLAAGDDREDYFPVGWLELDNGFFFTVDQAMHAGVKELFG